MSPPRIAIVDDDDLVLEATRGLLRSLGYAASAYGSAEEFLQGNARDSADCLITDVQMPGVDGIELARRLRAAGRDLPVIFVSAHADERIRARTADGGAWCVLPKPFREDLLIDCLERALSRSAGTGRRDPGASKP